MDQYLGQIFMFGGNYAPVNYAYCNGEILPIVQFQALYALLGTTYGGNGTVTFGLPNLKGRTPIGTGSAPGLPTYSRGQSGGQFRTTLDISQMPAHTHQTHLFADTDPADSIAPVTNGALAKAPTGGQAACLPYEAATSHISSPTLQDPGLTPLTSAGNTQMFTHYPPLIVVDYIIVTAGIFPSQN
jgi:microcystin-dependent protein